MKFISLSDLKKRYHLRDYRFGLVFLTLCIAIFGVFMVNSAAPHFMTRQLAGVIGGVVVMVIISLIDYKWVLRLYWVMYVFNLILLISTYLFGVTVNNARRWLAIGPENMQLQFQPSDLTKIIVILFFAMFFTKKREKVNKPLTIIQAVLLMIPSLILILRQPNLSNTIVIGALFAVIVYLSGISQKFVAIVLGILIPAVAVFLIIVIQPNQNLIHDYQQTRILAWLNPEEFAGAEALQQNNSVMGIGSGQLWGKGYNSDASNSLKNANFIIEGETDFIFAIIGEELGFVGCSAVIILLLLIVISCIRIGFKAQDLAGKIICGGVGSLIGIQTFINIGVATQMLPNTGLSLPFVSYGLTSVVTFFIGIGFVLNVGLQPDKRR